MSQLFLHKVELMQFILVSQDFSARKTKDFSFEELKETTSYCHIRNVKVYVTMNTLIFDRELEDALECVKKL